MESMIVDLAFQITKWERFRYDLSANAQAEPIGDLTTGRAFSRNESILSIVPARKACAGSSP
jgi:hypothetical protein